MRSRSTLRTAAQGLCGLALITLHVLGGYFVLNAPEGPWDTGVEALAAGLTAAFVAVAGL